MSPRHARPQESHSGSTSGRARGLQEVMCVVSRDPRSLRVMTWVGQDATYSCVAELCSIK